MKVISDNLYYKIKDWLERKYPRYFCFEPLHKVDTNLPVHIFIDTENCWGKYNGNYFVKVQNNYKEKYNIHKTFWLSIEENPKIIKGKNSLNINDFQTIINFVKKYREQIIKMSNMEYEYFDFLNLIEDNK